MNRFSSRNPEYEGEQYDALVEREINVDELERSKASYGPRCPFVTCGLPDGHDGPHGPRRSRKEGFDG